MTKSDLSHLERLKPVQPVLLPVNDAWSMIMQKPTAVLNALHQEVARKMGDKDDWSKRAREGIKAFADFKLLCTHPGLVVSDDVCKLALRRLSIDLKGALHHSREHASVEMQQQVAENLTALAIEKNIDAILKATGLGVTQSAERF